MTATKNKWVYCPKGIGLLHDINGDVSPRKRHFKENSVGLVKEYMRAHASVWLIGTNAIWDISMEEIIDINVLDTGDKYDTKICNICHCLLSVEEFAPNQNNLHGIVRRPSCKSCRTDIDKRAPKSSQAKQFEKSKPKNGDPFKCPICQKRSIVGVTAKIVADHNHHTGDIRDFICDSCNTGLGRFKNGKDCLKDALVYIKERGG